MLGVPSQTVNTFTFSMRHAACPVDIFANLGVVQSHFTEPVFKVIAVTTSKNFKHMLPRHKRVDVLKAPVDLSLAFDPCQGLG
jgi:hypothetical protein